MANLFIDIGIILIVATLFGTLAKVFRQPLILGYMLAGILIGPVGFGLVKDFDTILTLSEIGIAFLLFVVGMDLDIRKVKNLGVPALFVGLGQVLFTFIAAYFIAGAFGFSPLPSLYVSLALTLSSTFIVIKLYSDKNELNTLHGRLALGVLIVQDFVAVIALTLLSVKVVSLPFVMVSLFKGVVLFFLAFVLGAYVLDKVFAFFAKSQELLFVGAVSWCFLYSIVAYFMGYSIAIGAFLAGLSLATLPYNIEIVGKIKSLRDFFVIIFFVALGMQILITSVDAVLYPVIIFSLFVLIGNPILVTLIMSFMGFKAKTSFFTGLGFAQISEFSLIMVALGFQQGILSQDIVSIVALIAVITFTVSSYYIVHENRIYKLFAKVLKPLEKLSYKKTEPDVITKEYSPEVLVCGSNRVGSGVLKALQDLKKDVFVVDYDPEVVNNLSDEGINCIYGDIGDQETLDQLKCKKLKLVISTVANVADNSLLVRVVKRKNRKVRVIVTAERVGDALELYKQGADYVILPHLLGGEHLAYLLKESISKQDFIKKRKMHITELRRRIYGHKNGHKKR